MTSVSRQECHELASLARLSLSDAEADTFAAQLGPIIEHLAQLRTVDTSDVPEHLPPARIGSGLRDDTAAPTLPRERALQGAPSVADDHIVVPKFKED